MQESNTTYQQWLNNGPGMGTLLFAQLEEIQMRCALFRNSNINSRHRQVINSFTSPTPLFFFIQNRSKMHQFQLYRFNKELIQSGRVDCDNPMNDDLN